VQLTAFELQRWLMKDKGQGQWDLATHTENISLYFFQYFNTRAWKNKNATSLNEAYRKPVFLQMHLISKSGNE